ncbi:MAG: hypothetical protein MUQ56_09950 [Thermoleophilia bacterium]|nr:hypothetical protein [Thermoleophilia bacterium]
MSAYGMELVVLGSAGWVPQPARMTTCLASGKPSCSWCSTPGRAWLSRVL